MRKLVVVLLSLGLAGAAFAGDPPRKAADRGSGKVSAQAREGRRVVGHLIQVIDSRALIGFPIGSEGFKLVQAATKRPTGEELWRQVMANPARVAIDNGVVYRFYEVRSPEVDQKLKDQFVEVLFQRDPNRFADDVVGLKVVKP